MPNTGASTVNTSALYPAFSALLINDIVKSLHDTSIRFIELVKCMKLFGWLVCLPIFINV